MRLNQVDDLRQGLVRINPVFNLLTAGFSVLLLLQGIKQPCLSPQINTSARWKQTYSLLKIPGQRLKSETSYFTSLWILSGLNN
jgi:hypothetical protein